MHGHFRVCSDLGNPQTRQVVACQPGPCRQRKKTAVHSGIEEVVIASRETAVYMRQMQDTGVRNHESEAHLSVLWTNLGFELQDIGIDKLAKRCQIKGKEWANPDHYDDDFLKKAHVSLERMEKLANEILSQINR